MTEPRKRPAKKTAEPEPVLVDETAEEPEPSRWEFVERVPKVDEVRDLLKSLRPVWGIKAVDYLDYVAALNATKNLKRKGRDNYKEVWNLYMSVAGRQAMLNAAQELNGWMVDQRPTPEVPEGNPVGFIHWDDKRAVYRVDIEIWQALVPASLAQPASDAADFRGWAGLWIPSGRPSGMHAMPPVRLGVRSGQAWVPGMPDPAKKDPRISFPFERVETAAIGRCIAHWGLGLLPGSGVSSLDEMIGQQANRDMVSMAEAQTQKKESQPELEKEILDLAEDLRLATGKDLDQKWMMLVERVKRITSEDVAVARDPAGVPVPDESHEIPVDFHRLRPSQVRLVRNSLRRELEGLEAT